MWLSTYTVIPRLAAADFLAGFLSVFTLFEKEFFVYKKEIVGSKDQSKNSMLSFIYIDSRLDCDLFSHLLMMETTH